MAACRAFQDNVKREFLNIFLLLLSVLKYVLSLVFVCRFFACVFLVLKNLSLYQFIFNSSYYLWEIFVLNLSSNLLFTRNRSSVLTF